MNAKLCNLDLCPTMIIVGSHIFPLVFQHTRIQRGRGDAAHPWRAAEEPQARVAGKPRPRAAGKPQAGIKPQGLSPCFSFQNENMLFSRPLFGVRKLTQNPLTPRCNKQFQSGLHFWVRFCSKRWRHVVVVFTKTKRIFGGKIGPKMGVIFWTPFWGHA